MYIYIYIYIQLFLSWLARYGNIEDTINHHNICIDLINIKARIGKNVIMMHIIGIIANEKNIIIQ